MKKQIICFSGWGQKFDSLNHIFLSQKFSDFEIISLNYAIFDNVEAFFADVLARKLNPEILVGWSLGGQLALRLVQREILRPKKLVLIAPPFQMVKNARIQAGMARATFDEFYGNFKKAPDTTLKKFSILTSMNDKNSSEIARSLEISEKNFNQLVFWLEELARFSFFDFDFSKTPQTLYFHGFGDMIVHISQLEYFKERIANFQGEIFKNCGHAPHLSDLEKFQEKLFEFLRQ